MLVGAAVAAFSGALCVPEPRPDGEGAAASRTMSRMLLLSSAIGTYQVDHDGYPDVSSVAELQRLLMSAYPDLLQEYAEHGGDRSALDLFRDGWGTEMAYEAWNHGQDFRLVCAGSDLRFDRRGWDKEERPLSLAEDAVMINSVFVRIWSDVEPAPSVETAPP